MGLPIGLSKKGERIYQFIVRAQREGLSFNKFQATMIRTGLGYRRAEMLRDWRIVGSYLNKERMLERIPTKEIIRREYYLPKISTMKTRYATKVKVRVFNERTQRSEDKYIVLGHNRLMTKKELIEMAKDYIRRRKYDPLSPESKNFIVEDFGHNIVEAYRPVSPTEAKKYGISY